jgi:hypothetical protein
VIERPVNYPSFIYSHIEWKRRPVFAIGTAVFYGYNMQSSNPIEMTNITAMIKLLCRAAGIE